MQRDYNGKDDEVRKRLVTTTIGIFKAEGSILFGQLKGECYSQKPDLVENVIREQCLNCLKTIEYL